MSQWQPNEKPNAKSCKVIEAEAPAVELVVKEAAETAEPQVPKSTPGATATSANNPTAHSGETPPDLGLRYDVLELVGSGGMGTVWKVYDKQLAETFAIKVLKPELISDATALKRFEKEANLASDLTHANIAAIFGPGTDDKGRPYIIMRFVDGESLADILAREGKFSEERALDIFSQICEALSHSHMKGIVHRDIKPSNIIISKTESGGDMVHIVDFGIARCVYDEVTKTQALTKAVDVFGSPRYMSPEQLLGQTATEQSDIYALGCVLYEMLTGAPPFTDDNPVKLILQHISEPPDLSKVPIDLQRLLNDCLGKESFARFKNIGGLQLALSRVGTVPSVLLENLTAIHCAAPLFLLSCLIGLTDRIIDEPSTAGFIACMFALAWLYIAFINRLNAAPARHYLLIEVGLFISVIAAAMVTLIAWLLPGPSSVLVGLFLCTTSFWLITRASAAEKYSNAFKTIADKLNSAVLIKYRAQKQYNKKTAELILNGGCKLLLLTTTMTLMTPLLVLICGQDLSISPVNSLLLSSAAGFVTLLFFTSLAKLAMETLLHRVKAKESFIDSIKWSGIFTALVATITLLANTLWANGDLYRYNRQDIAEMAAPQDRARVQLEALQYPDTEISNRARLIAAREIYSDKGNLNDAATLCTQIIDSKALTDPNLLIEAHLLRAKLSELNQTDSATIKTDLSQALALISAKPNTPSSNLQILGPFNGRAGQAIRLGKSALTNGDIALSQQAVKIAKETEGLSQWRRYELKNLETQIEDYQIKSKSTTSGAHQQ
jgi:tRNA A-37 threonylcarbamoyl transferase component Bud32